MAVTDGEALAAFGEVTRLEGIIPALESAHALAWVLAQTDGELDLVCLSGRGDKDLAEVLALTERFREPRARGSRRNGRSGRSGCARAGGAGRIARAFSAHGAARR